MEIAVTTHNLSALCLIIQSGTSEALLVFSLSGPDEYWMIQKSMLDSLSAEEELQLFHKSLTNVCSRFRMKQNWGEWCHIVVLFYTRYSSITKVIWRWKIGIHHPKPSPARWRCWQSSFHKISMCIECCKEVSTSWVAALMQGKSKEAALWVIPVVFMPCDVSICEKWLAP